MHRMGQVLREISKDDRTAAVWVRPWVISMGALMFMSSSLFSSEAEAYNTYIVGDSIGWVAPFTNPINYTLWASNKTFSLGDTLVFNYAANHTVEQTDSYDTYVSCDPIDSNDTTIQVWSSEGSTQSIVRLSSTGTTYFLCSAYDGTHCLGGMRFPITVYSGEGLPPSSPPSGGGDENQSPNSDNGFVLSPPPPPSGGSSAPTSGGDRAAQLPVPVHLLCLTLIFAAASIRSALIL